MEAVRLSRRAFFKVAAMAGVAAILPQSPAGAASGAAPAGKRLNFVFILIDDMGWMDLGCYGSRFYETPNIDRLAAQGMRFTQGYAACPVCSPTRASIQTGKYPARLHLTDFIPGARRGRLNPPEYFHYLPLEEVTVAEALKEAGYATGFFGKWHLGGDDQYFPDRQGYDVNVGGTGAGSPRSYFSPYQNPKIPDGPAGEYLTDRLGEEAAKFIEAHRTEPFFVFLSHYAVHNPLQAKKDVVARYEAKAAALPQDKPRFMKDLGRDVRQVQDHAVYAGVVQGVDECVGRVMKKLDDAGLADSTVIIFMSDNGGLATSEGTPTANVPLRAGKGWLYEGGIREPWIVRWPGVVRPGSTCGEPVISTDFYPTILEMAGLPLRPKQHCDGLSIVSLLKESGKPAREALYWHYPHYGNQGGAPSGAIRCGDLKLIEWFEDNRVELYNLKDDLGEHNDLAAGMPEKAAELRNKLQEWRRSVDAAMPTPNPDYGKPGSASPKKGAADKTEVSMLSLDERDE